MRFVVGHAHFHFLADRPKKFEIRLQVYPVYLLRYGAGAHSFELNYYSAQILSFGHHLDELIVFEF